MFFITSKILTFLIKPIFWILILFSSSLIFKRIRSTLIIISIFTYWFFGNSFIIDTVFKQWEEKTISISQINQVYDYGIVLGGYSSYDEDLKNIEFNECGDRLFYTMKLYKLGKINKIVISGGNGQLINEGYMESNWSKDFLVDFGIPEDDIIIENKSRNTWENALYTYRLIKPNTDNRLLLITSGWHMKRATFCFNKNHIQIDPFPTDFTKNKINLNLEYLLLPNASSYEKWDILIKEIIGNLVYRIRY